MKEEIMGDEARGARFNELRKDLEKREELRLAWQANERSIARNAKLIRSDLRVRIARLLKAGPKAMCTICLKLFPKTDLSTVTLSMNHVYRCKHSAYTQTFDGGIVHRVERHHVCGACWNQLLRDPCVTEQLDNSRPDRECRLISALDDEGALDRLARAFGLENVETREKVNSISEVPVNIISGSKK